MIREVFQEMARKADWEVRLWLSGSAIHYGGFVHMYVHL